MMNRIIGFCSGLCLVSLFGFLLIMIVSFSYPNSSIARLFGNNERNISIGLLFINNSKSMPADLMIDETVCELNGRMLRTTLLAIKHINELVFLTRKENNFVSAQVGVTTLDTSAKLATICSLHANMLYKILAKSYKFNYIFSFLSSMAKY